MEVGVIIAGGRDFNDYPLLVQKSNKILSKYKEYIIHVISGKAKGADERGELYAKQKHFDLIEKPADWDKYGKSAGYRRNVDMAKCALEFDVSILIAFWDGVSKGTKHMIDIANEYGLEVHVINY